MRLWLTLGALNGLAAVLMGAMTGHAGALEEAAQAAAQTAVRYQFWHALALLAVAWLAARPEPRPWLVALAGGSFLLGCLLFSGLIYLRALTGWQGLAPGVPVGGLAFIGGWASLVLVGLTLRRSQ